MPVYLTREEIDSLDAMALQELEQNGGYLEKPKPRTSNVAPYSLLAGPSPATSLTGNLSSPSAGIVPPSTGPTSLAAPSPMPQITGGLSSPSAPISQIPNLAQYPMPNTSTWVSGADAAKYLGIPYDPNALYERPWAPGEYGIPLETLFNQLIRDQQNAQNTSPYSLAGGVSPATNWTGALQDPTPAIPYGPGAQQATSGVQLPTAPSRADLMRAGDIQQGADSELARYMALAAPPSQGMGIDPSVGALKPRGGLPNVPGVDVLGLGKDVGGGIMDLLDLGREYVGVPYLGSTVNLLEQAKSNPLALASLMPGPNTANTILNYDKSKERGEEIRESAYNTSRGLGVGVDILSDPLTYLAPGALKSVATRFPALRPATSLIEGVGGPSKALPLALGAAGGTELATRFDVPGIPEPLEQLGGGLLGGMAGLGAASLKSGARGLDVPVNRAVPEPGRIPPEQPSRFGGYQSPDAYAIDKLRGLTRGAPGISQEAGEADGLLRLVYRDASGNPVGVLQFSQRSADITDIAVAKTARRTGVAEALVNAAKGRGSQRAIGPITPESEALLSKTGISTSPRLGDAAIGGAQEPTETFQRAVEGWTPYEKKPIAMLRQYEGEMGTQGLELQRTLDQGNALLKQQGIGRQNGRNLVVTREQGEALTRALHGEAEVPPNLQGVYDDLRRLYDAEEALTKQFDPNFTGIEGDYTYRGWREIPISEKEALERLNRGAGMIEEADTVVPNIRQRAQSASGPFGVKPGFTKQRANATFDELLDSVSQKPSGEWIRREPISWNPYEMYALRKEAGVRYRTQKAFVDKLRDADVAHIVARGEPIPDGFRVPKVGPAFEGKPVPFIGSDDTAAVMFTPQIAVPNKMANVLENIYGRGPQVQLGDVDILKYINRTSAGLKQAKLWGSLFQQVDFALRTQGAGFAGALDALRAGKPITAAKTLVSIPKAIGDEVWANLSPTRRSAIRDEILDSKPLFKERPDLSYRTIAEAGWQTQDITWVTRGIRDTVDDITKGVTNAAPVRTVKAVNRAMQNGLFDGVYPTSQMYALKKFIVPKLMRQHPDWTSKQIAAQAADEVNKMFSSLGNYQTVFKDKGLRAFMHNILFSTNETESLLRQAVSTVTGPNKAMWQEYFLGYFIGTAVIAEIVNKAVTGEWLPLENFAPLERDKYSPLGVSYNRDFMSPVVGEFGRGGSQVSLDLVGQMDTVFSFLTDPKGAIESRFNVLPRAGMNQWQGEDFFGRPIDTWGPKGVGGRLQQLASDLGFSIGSQNVLEAGRQVIPGLDKLPEQEGRLGPLGALTQATGVNLRAETTAVYKDRLASEWAAENGETKIDMDTGKDTGEPITSFWDLTPSQRKAFEAANTEMTEELERRDAIAITQGSESAQRRTEARGLVEEQAAEQKKLDDALQSLEITPSQWTDARRELLLEFRTRRDDLYKDMPEREEKTALDRYYDQIEAATTVSGTDWDAVDAWFARQPKTVQDFIADNTGLGGSPVEKEYRAAVDRIVETKYFDVADDMVKEVTIPRLQEAGITLPVTVDTKSELETWLRQDIAKEIRKDGLDPNSARGMAVTKQILDAIFKDSNELTSKIHKGMREQIPGLMEDLIEWGYYDPSKEATAQLLEATP